MKLKITQFKKQAEDGESTPKWYGLAYYDFNTNVRIFYPIPIHLLVALYRRVYIAIKWKIGFGVMNYEWKNMEPFKDKWYRKGQEDGYEKGRDEDGSFLQELRDKTAQLEKIAEESQDESHN